MAWICPGELAFSMRQLSQDCVDLILLEDDGLTEYPLPLSQSGTARVDSGLPGSSISMLPSLRASFADSGNRGPRSHSK